MLILNANPFWSSNFSKIKMSVFWRFEGTREEQIDMRSLILSSECKFENVCVTFLIMMFLGDYLIINSFIRTPAVTTVDGLPPELSEGNVGK